ncbi:matrix metallo ase-17-like protein [Labeo rohita]|uniref:Matrix metallo ase-17-like protein n=1 Tax=Labeo rohita TaxID=84645 RepID=A0A498NKH5_LABRO|nr:matrix metallo ase-17-like protein [Labeo rohita]
MEVEAGYPRPIGKDWLVCTEMQSDSPEMQNNSNTRLHGQHHADHAENGYEDAKCSQLDLPNDSSPDQFQLPNYARALKMLLPSRLRVFCKPAAPSYG